MIFFFNSLDELEALSSLSGLKELTLDGNALTQCPNYIVYVVGTLPSLQQLDANSISVRLRREADSWASRHLHVDPSTLTQPSVSVQNKSNVAVVRPMSIQCRAEASIDAPDAPDATAGLSKDHPLASDLKRTESGNFFLKKKKIKTFFFCVLFLVFRGLYPECG